MIYWPQAIAIDEFEDTTRLFKMPQMGLAYGISSDGRYGVRVSAFAGFDIAKGSGLRLKGTWLAAFGAVSL